MKRAPGAPESGDLLNLPLAGPEADADAIAVQEPLPLEPPDPDAMAELEPAPDGDIEGLTTRRIRAGFVDLGATVAGLVLAVGGAWLLGPRPTLASMPPLLLFAASFSFLYLVVPLTFWGQSPGMAIVGLTARTQSGEPLTIQQAVARWAGAAATTLGLGLPLLVLLSSNRSVADRLSNSRLTETARL